MPRKPITPWRAADERVVDELSKRVDCRPSYIRKAARQFGGAAVAFDLFLRIVDEMEAAGTVRAMGEFKEVVHRFREVVRSERLALAARDRRSARRLQDS
jgi:hypothetical protein